MARLYRYKETGTVSYPFTKEVLAESEEDAEAQVEADDIEYDAGEPSVCIDTVDGGWDDDDDMAYTPKKGGYLDNEDLY